MAMSDNKEKIVVYIRAFPTSYEQVYVDRKQCKQGY